MTTENLECSSDIVGEFEEVFEFALILEIAINI